MALKPTELNVKDQLRHTIQRLNLGRSVPYTRRGTKAGRRVIRRKPRIIRRGYNQAKVKYVDKLHGVSATNLVHLVNSNGLYVSSVPTNGTSVPNSVSTISTLVSSRHDPPIGSNINRVNHENLHPVKIINPDCKASDPLTIVSLNCRSVNNKAMAICDFIIIKWCRYFGYN